MVRARFMVESVTKNAPYNGKQTATVRMRPVWTGSEENKCVCDWFDGYMTLEEILDHTGMVVIEDRRERK